MTSLRNINRETKFVEMAIHKMDYVPMEKRTNFQDVRPQQDFFDRIVRGTSNYNNRIHDTITVTGIIGQFHFRLPERKLRSADAYFANDSFRVVMGYFKKRRTIERSDIFHVQNPRIGLLANLKQINLGSDMVIFIDQIVQMEYKMGLVYQRLEAEEEEKVFQTARMFGFKIDHSFQVDYDPVTGLVNYNQFFCCLVSQDGYKITNTPDDGIHTHTAEIDSVWRFYYKG